jgi:hypothetical protein
MKTILTLTLSSIAAYFLMLLLPLILLAWLRGRDITRRPQFDAANCAEYLNTDSGTNYTAAEIDDAFRRAMLGMWIDEVQKRITEK